MRGQGEESEREKQIGEKVERERGSEKRLFRLLSTLRGRRSMKKRGQSVKRRKRVNASKSCNGWEDENKRQRQRGKERE